MNHIDVNAPENRLVKAIIDNTKCDISFLKEIILDFKSPHIRHRIGALIEEELEAMRDIYTRSQMKIPEWCIE